MTDPGTPTPAAPVDFDDAALARLVRFGGARLLGSMVDMFRTLGPQRAAAARAAVERGDAAGARLEFHSLKSSAAQLGAESLSRLCAQAEAVAAAGTVDALPALVGRLDAAVAEAIDWMDRTAQHLTTPG